MQDQTVHQFQAENGLTVRLRPLQPTDAAHLVNLFQHLSDDSRYRRFNLALADPDPDWVQMQAEQLAHVRPAHGRAWLAFADLPDRSQAPVAGLSYIRSRLDAAEVSLVVRDDLHNLGIGRELLRYAGRKAYADGIRYLMGTVQSSNQPLWHSLNKLDVPIRRRREGSQTIVEVDLQEAEVFHWKSGRSGSNEPPG